MKLRARMDADGWTQSEAAARLGVSQGQLSKILNGIHQPGRRTRTAIRAAVDGIAGRQAFASEVAEAAEASTDFRLAVEAVLRIMR